MGHPVYRSRSVRCCVMAALVFTAVLAQGCASSGDDPADMSDAIAASPPLAKSCLDASARGACTLKVMTLNLRHDADQWKRRFELIADEIARLDPDLIGLQEIEIADDQAKHLNRLLSDRGAGTYHVHQHRKMGIRGWFTGEGVGVMSRLDFEEKHDEDLGDMRLANHVRVRIPAAGGRTIELFNTHLSAGGDKGDWRKKQAAEIASWTERRSSSASVFEVLTGDMNATPGTEPIRAFTDAGFIDSYAKRWGNLADRLGATSPIRLEEGAEQNPRNRIDFVFYRGSANVKTANVVLRNKDAKGFYPSDHLAVMTTFELEL